MPDSVFTYRMPAGIPGELSRFDTYGATVKPESQNTTTPVNAFGQVTTLDTNGARPIAAGDAAAPAVIGISIRPFPSADYNVGLPYGNVAFGSGIPAPRGVIDICYRGYVTMKLNVGAAVKGGAVYVYSPVSNGNHVQAGIEAGAGAGLWQLPGAYFTGPADANGNVEVAYRI